MAITHGRSSDRTEWMARQREKATGGDRAVFTAKVRPTEPGRGGGAGLRNGEGASLGGDSVFTNTGMGMLHSSSSTGAQLLHCP